MNKKGGAKGWSKLFERYVPFLLACKSLGKRKYRQRKTGLEIISRSVEWMIVQLLFIKAEGHRILPGHLVTCSNFTSKTSGFLEQKPIVRFRRYCIFPRALTVCLHCVSSCWSKLCLDKYSQLSNPQPHAWAVDRRNVSYGPACHSEFISFPHGADPDERLALLPLQWLDGMRQTELTWYMTLATHTEGHTDAEECKRESSVNRVPSSTFLDTYYNYVLGALGDLPTFA